MTPRIHAAARLRCRRMGNSYPLDEPRWRSDAGGLLDIEFHAEFPRAAIAARPPGIWRYREAIPIPADAPPVTFGEGMTPLADAEFHGRRVKIKLDHLFPSGSYKDRGASVMITHARRIGVRSVVEDSSGNAGAAVAAYCARAGLACHIYAPASNSPAKLSQITCCGARLHPIPGSREDTAAAALQAAEHEYYASHVWNPFFFHGTKTFAFEVVEQLGWRAPDALVIPTGNGTLLIGAMIGFRELLIAGVIDRMPRLFAVQARNCAPLADARRGAASPATGRFLPTLAEGIAIAAPQRAEQCLEAVESTGGDVLAVSEEQIVAALKLALKGGFFIEPTCAAAIAALEMLPIDLSADCQVIVPITGHGLKAADKLAKLLSREEHA